MTGREAAEIAFRKCKSRSIEKNQACAPFIARLLLVEQGLTGDELQRAADDAKGALDAMFHPPLPVVPADDSEPSE